MEDVKKRIIRKLNECKKIAITSHIRPDGDSIGSGIALYLTLKRMGKEVKYLNKDEVKPPISRFPYIGVIEYRDIYPEEFDCVLLIECSSEKRSGQKGLDNYFRILIDHHKSNEENVELNWVRPQEAAVAVMVYELLVEMGVEIDSDIAFLLYSGIVSDTGGFRFTNTNSKAFRVAADLIDLGADPIKTNSLLFEGYSASKVRLMGDIFRTLEIEKNGHVAYIYMLSEFLKKNDLLDVETEDIVTIVRGVEGVKLVVFFKQMDDDKFRVSVRSRGHIDSSKISEFFGGGGHMHAAGFFIEGFLEDVKRRVKDKVDEFYKF